MKKLNLNDISKILNVHQQKNVNGSINYVTNDIKKIENDTLVFHLNKDEELNIDQFKLLENCYIVTDQPLLKGLPIQYNYFLYVLNVETAYRSFINYYRSLFEIPIVAITGTCGKTTTKEMINQVLKHKYNVIATISNKNSLNYNNDYLMSIDDSTDLGVFETAISYPGNLIYSCEFFKPTIGIITTIGIDHLNGCKSVDNYIRTKGEILAGLQYKGTLIINNDDENIKKIDLSHYHGKVITFGIKQQSDFYGMDIQYSDQGMMFSLKHDKQNYPVYIPGFGEHNVYNALASLAVLDTLGMDLNESINHLVSFKHIRSHLEFHQGIRNSTIIDDTWSSNPTSMNAAFKVLSEKGKGKVKIAVLGKISFLGKFAEQYYEKIAEMLVNYKIDFLITQDSFAKQIGKKAIDFGMDPNHFIHCKNNHEVKSTLECLLDANTIVLFKVSMLDQTLTRVMKELKVE